MEDLEQLRVFNARQQAQLDQLQQQVQQQQVHQAQARQASPVGQDLSELRSIVDTRVMEKIPIFDVKETHFAEWRFTFEATCGLLGLEEVLRQAVLSTHDEASLSVFAQQPGVSLKNKEGCVLSPGCVVPRPSAGSCQRSTKTCWTRGMASDGPFV